MHQTPRYLYSSLRLPGIQPGTARTAIALATLVIDIVVAVNLLFAGNSLALSHLLGFVTSGTLLLLLRLTHVDTSVVPFHGDTPLRRFFAVGVYAIIQMAIRAGVIASLAMSGMDDWSALVLGIVLATLLGNYSSGLFLARHNTISRWLSLGIVLIVSAFALRLAFLGALEVTPQEAYYWNYAQHLAPGYLDHPPMVAITVWLSEAVFGHNAFGTRFGAFLYGILFILVFYRFARLQVNNHSAILASALALIPPYFFLNSGFIITPDAPLALAWVMALYFFYRALLMGENRAWYGVGIAMGIGMLSKYTIILLAPAALLFIIVDPQARRLLLRKEPYLAAVLAILILSPVIYWNATHEWASFRFQGSERFIAAPQFSLHLMLKNIMVMLTPLPLLALPYLFMSRILRNQEAGEQPFTPRVRLFIQCFLLVPMSVFAWNALENEPRLTWTGPVWIPFLPMLAWLILHSAQLRLKAIGTVLKTTTAPLLIVLLCVYAFLLHFLTLGLPGIDYPRGMAYLIGWPKVVREIQTIQQQLPEQTRPVIVSGLDTYFIPSKLAYYGTPQFLDNDSKLDVTGAQILGENSLMFAFWHPPMSFRDSTIIMLARTKHYLNDNRLAPYFESLSEKIRPLPVIIDNFGQPPTTVQHYYYRIGYGYQPPQGKSSRE